MADVDELITVQEFANRYRVDASIVRWWIKTGAIDYELYGPRHLKRIRPSAVLKPIIPAHIQNPPAPPAATQGANLGESTGVDVVTVDPITLQSDEAGTNESGQAGPGGEGQGADDQVPGGRENKGSTGDADSVRVVAPVPQVARRGRGSSPGTHPSRR